jgi:hypothetical protein
MMATPTYKVPDAFPGIYVNASCVVSLCFNGDGYLIYLWGRSVPAKFGEMPRSYLFQNDGKVNYGHDLQLRKELENVGFVTWPPGLTWIMMEQDLVLSPEWGNRRIHQ